MNPIGVFDSGVGGLSILQALRAELPSEHFVYVADTGHAPYGEREPGHVLERSRAITAYLRHTHGVKLLVVACNTATALAIGSLRGEHTDLPCVGVEPALKPALAHSRTGHIGVLATRATLASDKFAALLASVQDSGHFVCQPCDGLARAIEAQDATQIVALCARYTSALGIFGSKEGAIDTLVLGCTHYPFAREQIEATLPAGIALMDTGPPVARQTRRLLADELVHTGAGTCRLYATGDTQTLERGARHWLALHDPVLPVLLD